MRVLRKFSIFFVLFCVQLFILFCFISFENSFVVGFIIFTCIRRWASYILNLFWLWQTGYDFGVRQ